MSDYLLDNFVTTKPGEPYRLLPFGRIVKGGRSRDITPEYAARFRLPHFQPPVKLGSHDERTPAGGHIARLEVRDDGLYAWPTLNDGGEKALSEGHYRYHSPEIIWDDGGLEDPETGETITGPLIVGDALLHTPHLGERAALYSVEPFQEGGDPMSETVQVDKGLWEKIRDLFTAKPEEQPPAPVVDPETPAAPVVDPELLEAERAKVATLQAEVERLNAEKAQADLYAALGAQFDVTEYGAAFPAMKAEAVPVLAGMSEENRAWVIERFRALSAQINESALVGEVGKAGGEPPVNALHAAITAHMAEHKTDYPTAFEAVRRERPELLTL